MSREYRTTIGAYQRGQHHSDPGNPFGGTTCPASADDPVPPDEPGEWRLVSSAAADGLLFWTWESLP